jgi:inorganic pyrophosphatase
MPESFFAKLNALLTISKIIIDRPKGSAHPRFNSIIYPLDYGYLDETSGGDGGGIDVWFGSLTSEKQIVAIAITVDTVKRDAEVKILVNCTDDELQIIAQFHTGSTSACTIIRREL